jgi:hypothetical protein
MKVVGLRTWFDREDGGWYAASNGCGMDPIYGPCKTEQEAIEGLTRALAQL